MCARPRVLLLTLVALVGSLLLSPAPAHAVALGRGVDSFVFDDPVTDFCGVAGLTVQNTGTFTTHFTLKSVGRAQLPHFSEHIDLVQTFTNADGVSVSIRESTLSKDFKVTDNHDGTFSIVVLATGRSSLYGPDGKAIARNPGQVRYEILIDNGGTPSDPNDDTFLTFVRDVKGSTGRSDDYCGPMVALLG